MMSLDDLRRLIDRPDMSDAEAEKVRDDLYQCAKVMIEGYLWEQGKLRCADIEVDILIDRTFCEQ